jgi:hypothetical protein
MKAKVYIAIPVYRYYEFQAKHSLDDMILQAENWQMGIYRELYHVSLISKARNFFAEDFLKSDCTHLFFMDADMVCYTPKGIDILVGDDLPIVAAPYIYKDYPLKPAFRIGKTNEDGADLRGLVNPIKAKYVSAGFMLIQKKVIRDVKDLLTILMFRPVEVEDEYLSEDWAFCYRAKEVGWACYIEPTIKLGHLGMYPFTMDDYYRNYLKESEARK